MTDTRRYEQIVTRDHADQVMSVILEIKSETDRWLVGVELDTDGTIKSGRGYDERVHVIDVGTITRRTPLVMNNHYARFEKAVD